MSSGIIRLKQIEGVEAAAIAIRRLNLENTKTNKEVRRIENDYNRDIKNLFKKILADHKSTLMPIQELQQKYGKESRGLIRAVTSEIFIAGINYAARFTGDKYVYPSTKNIQTISSLADRTYEFFWRQIGRLIAKEEQANFGQYASAAPAVGQDEALDPLDTSSDLLFTTMATAPLAIATMQKYGELSANAPLSMTEPAPLVKVVFATKLDEKVCPICAPYEGTEWLTDDPFIIVPVQDTHPRCRCRLLLQTETGELLSG